MLSPANILDSLPSSAREKTRLFMRFKSKPLCELLSRAGLISEPLSTQLYNHSVSFAFSLPITYTKPVCPDRDVAPESEHWRRRLFCFTSHFFHSPKQEYLQSLLFFILTAYLKLCNLLTIMPMLLICNQGLVAVTSGCRCSFLADLQTKKCIF